MHSFPGSPGWLGMMEGAYTMGACDRTVVLKQRFDELASGLSELEDLRSRVFAAEQLQERQSHEGKPPPTNSQERQT